MTRLRQVPWHSNTTERNGMERSLREYEEYLAIAAADLAGQVVLDLGSGETELLSRELAVEAPTATVISLNPAYAKEYTRRGTSARHRTTNQPDWQHRSLAGLGEQLPFKTGSVDRILALYSLTSYAAPTGLSVLSKRPEQAILWLREIMRVLKPGGTAHLAEIGFIEAYADLTAELVANGFSYRFTPIISTDYRLHGTSGSRLTITKPLV